MVKSSPASPHQPRLQMNLQPAKDTGHVQTLSLPRWPGRGPGNQEEGEKLLGAPREEKFARCWPPAEAGAAERRDSPRRHAVSSSARKGRQLRSAQTRRPFSRAPTPILLPALFLSQDKSLSPRRSASSLWIHSHPQIRSPLLNTVVPSAPSHWSSR